MTLLSDVLYSLVCPAGLPDGPDESAILGCRMVGSAGPAATAADDADLGAQARAVWNTPGFMRPTAGDVLQGGVTNDLYTPGSRLDPDGILYVHFAVPTRMAISSTFLASDWRFIALASTVSYHGDVEKAVFTVYDAAGRRVQAMVDVAEIAAFPPRHLSQRQPTEPQRAVERVGPLCARCTRSGACVSLQAYLDAHPGLTTPPVDRGARARALFYERIELAIQMEALEKRRVEADREIARSCADGRLDLGGGDSISLPTRTISKYEFHKAKQILEQAGEWRDSFGAINTAVLQAALPTFSADLRKKVEAARIDTTTEPSISDAVRHGKHTHLGGSSSPTLRGVSK